MPAKQRVTCVLMGSKLLTSPEVTGCTGRVGEQRGGAVTVLLLSKNCNEALGQKAFLFVLKEKISPKAAARCDWTDVCGHMWNTGRCLGLTGAERCHFRLATYPVPPSTFVGSARLAGEHNMLQSEWMVLEEA